VKRLACGFRSTGRFQRAICFHLARLDPHPRPWAIVQPRLALMKRRMLEHSLILGHDDTPVRQQAPGKGRGPRGEKHGWECRYAAFSKMSVSRPLVASPEIG